MSGYEQVDVIIKGTTKKVGIVKGINEHADLAVIKVIGVMGLPILSFGNPKEMSLGAEVVALGYPSAESLGNELTVTKGIISSKRTLDDIEYLQIDAAINPGSSGGPLLDLEGQVLGINTFFLDGVESIALSISIDDVSARLEDLKSGARTLLDRPEIEEPPEITTYVHEKNKWTVDYPGNWVVGEFEKDFKGGYYTIETLVITSPEYEPYVELSVYRYVKQAQVISKLDDWNDDIKRSNKDIFEKYRFMSEEKVRRGKTRGILVSATTQSEDGPLFYILQWNVVTQRDNFIIELVADKAAWDLREQELRELVLSFQAT